MINETLLLDIFKIASPSREEDKMASFIEDFLKRNHIKYETDTYGNIFHFNGSKPLLMAHIDTVQDATDCLLTDFIKIRRGILSGYGVIGGDDKCGIYIILHLLKENKDINFAFTRDEEIGGLGALSLVEDRSDDIKKCNYGLILDRRGNGDIICFNNSYGIKKFEQDLEDIGLEYGYKPATGSWSDADQINHLISCANLSSGYYNAHTKTEFVILSDLENTIKYVNKILDTIKISYQPPLKTHKKKNKGYSTYYYNGQTYSYDDYDYLDEYDYLDFKECAFCKSASDLIELKSVDGNICSSCLMKLFTDIEDTVLERYDDEQIEQILEAFY